MEDQIAHYSKKLAYEIDSWDLKVAIEDGASVIVIDARSPDAFSSGHIPSAISIPHRQMDPESTSHLDKSALIVTYCDGIGCNASTKGALAMSKLGFKVRELIGGLDWWKRDGHQVSERCTPGAGACGCS
ncbi:MAG: rhodanese-like domain-containing protein [Gloeobacteraceae cyanobacterium ES-bin-144]|nr:rhodanese-like domain-containing protein [Verrucomicrobiales bacterium]